MAGRLASYALAAVPVGGTVTVDPKTTTGTVSGRIHYQADPARPWQYGRYYIADAKAGWLAEAVVALEGEGLADSVVAPSTVTVDQKNFQFVPETLALRAGDAVRFSNSDEALHNVMTFQGPAPFNVNLPQGREYVHRFPAGQGFNQPILLSCVYHGAMRGWIYVFPHPFFGLTGKDGGFRFENVPAGSYRLRVVHPAGGLDWTQEVMVKKNETVEISVALSPDQKKK